MSWSLGAQQELVLASLSNSTRSLRSHKLFLSVKIITSGWCIKFLGNFLIIQSFYCVVMASDLGATTRSTGLHCCHKNLQASNLHAFRMNGVHHGFFCVAWSIREIRAEICLGQIFHCLGWGACANYFRTGAAWLRFTNDNHRHQRKQI